MAISTLSGPSSGDLERSGMQAIERHPRWAQLSQLPVRLVTGVPLKGFTVRDLVMLQSEAVVESDWAGTDDVPFRIGHTQVAWCEFEVVEGRLAVRVTRLA